MTPPLSEAVKREYLIVTRDLVEMKYLVDEVPTPFAPRDWYRQRRWLNQGAQYLQRSAVAATNDRERSRRVLQLLFANWLAQCDKPAKERAKVAVRDPVPIYESDPQAPLAARAVDPQVLARELKRTMLAKQAFTNGLDASAWEFDGKLARERARQASLVVTLAEQLYRREYGHLPASARDLVGTYLKALPDGYVDRDPQNR
jgi:hypothetical protein